MKNLTKQNVVDAILAGRNIYPVRSMGRAFAPTNIALVKYWGKRDYELNLPITSSLSITLADKGSYTTIKPIMDCCDNVVINDAVLDRDGDVVQKFVNYFDLLCGVKRSKFRLEMRINIPVAAGLASSACCYASMIKAFDHLYGWGLSGRELSIIARLGSGSACRSMWPGFVKWKAGMREDGMDCHGVPLDVVWPELRIGLCIVSEAKKPISSREAMQRTVDSSPLYKNWSAVVARDLEKLDQALQSGDFELLGDTAQKNALAMHAMIQQAKPAIDYNQPATLLVQKKIEQLRNDGHLIFFTQDAGPNLKLLFLQDDLPVIKDAFPEIEILTPFADTKLEQVVLVDNDDRALDVCDKIKAHEHGGQLHRAISVCVLRKRDGKYELLLQQRNRDKYHCGGLWANTCCSHPRPGEDFVSAGERRLQEEMGFAVDLYLLDSFIYRAKFANGLTEYELDYVLLGEVQDIDINYNEAEVGNIKWLELAELQQQLTSFPEKYVPWLPQVLAVLVRSLDRLLK